MQELRLKEYLIDLTSVTPEKILKTFLRLRERSSVCVTQLEAIHQEQAVRVETCLQALRQFLEPLGSSSVASILQGEPNRGPDWVSVTEYEYLRAHLNEIRNELWANQGQLSLAQEHLAERDARIQSQQDGLAERAQTIEQLGNTVQSQQAGLVERDGTIVHQQERRLSISRRRLSISRKC
jgi:chromosome segregation ATPase